MILASQGRFPCELAAFLGRELRHAYLAASAAMWLSLIVEAMATCFRRAWRRRRLHQQVFDPAVIADDLPCLVATAGGQWGDGASHAIGKRPSLADLAPQLQNLLRRVVVAVHGGHAASAQFRRRRIDHSAIQSRPRFRRAGKDPRREEHPPAPRVTALGAILRQ